MDKEESDDIDLILGEIINQMDQDEWIRKFKFLNKVYNSLENFRASAVEYNIEYVFDKMLHRYSDN